MLLKLHLVISAITHLGNCLFGSLPVITDLQPNDCLNQGLSYVETNGLPQCVQRTLSGTCFKHYGVIYSQNAFKPTCSRDNTYANKQCKGEPTTGRCFCFTAAGDRIFGQDWWQNADDMDCACSRRQYELQTSKDPKMPHYISLRCDSRGSYEPLQCDVVSQQCWCADPRTGDLTSPIVPEKASSKLPCYNTLSVGSQYLRQCESQAYAESYILDLLKRHGTVEASFDTLLCVGDGTYGAYKVYNGLFYCTWKDNSNLGTWQGDASDTADLDCNCARDSHIFTDAGKVQSHICLGNGNYKLFQTRVGINYCVDKDGYRSRIDEPTTSFDCDLPY